MLSEDFIVDLVKNLKLLDVSRNTTSLYSGCKFFFMNSTIYFQKRIAKIDINLCNKKVHFSINSKFLRIFTSNETSLSPLDYFCVSQGYALLLERMSTLIDNRVFLTGPYTLDKIKIPFSLRSVVTNKLPA